MAAVWMVEPQGLRVAVEATRLFGDAGEIAARNNWARLIGLVQQGRADLQPWKDSTAVRALDDRLASCGVA